MSDSQRGTDVASEPFHVMTKPTGPACNLACEYCYYLDTKDELYPDTDDFGMSEETLERYVKQYIAAHPGPIVNFAWQGGEPTLLGLDFFRTVVRLQRTHAPPDVRIVNSIQTNGTRLTDEWCRFFKRHDFLVGISIDGPRELHDRYRVTKGGTPTFDQVMEGLDRLQTHGVEYNVLCVVNSLNSEYPLEVYRFFKDHGIDWIQFIPLVEFRSEDPPNDSNPASPSNTTPPEFEPLESPEEPPSYDWPPDTDPPDDQTESIASTARRAPVTGRSVGPRAYGRFLRAIFDEWVRNDLGAVSIQLFDQCLQAWLKDHEPDLCVFTETCGRQLAIEHNGDLYSCDHFVEPGYKLGNIHEEPLADLVESRQQRQFGAFKRDGLPERCRSCDVRFVCHGGCPKNRRIETPDGDVGLNYLCPSYRSFFRYIDPYMETVAAGLERNDPPGRIMDRIRAMDAE